MIPNSELKKILVADVVNNGSAFWDYVTNRLEQRIGVNVLDLSGYGEAAKYAGDITIKVGEDDLQKTRYTIGMSTWGGERRIEVGVADIDHPKRDILFSYLSTPRATSVAQYDLRDIDRFPMGCGVTEVTGNVLRALHRANQYNWRVVSGSDLYPTGEK